MFGAVKATGRDSVGGGCSVFTSFTASVTSCEVLDSGWCAVASGQHCCRTAAPLRCSGVEKIDPKSFEGAASTDARGLRRDAEHDRSWQTVCVSIPTRTDAFILLKV